VEVLYQCLQCSHCLTWCVPEIDIAQIVETTRERLVAEEKYPSELDELRDSIVSDHNPFKEEHSKRTAWLAASGGGSKKVVYYSGCTAAYREQNIAKSAVELLESLDFDVAVTPEEWCCGSPLFRTGFRDTAIEQAKHNVEILNSIDADEIVTTCPGCYKTLAQDYPTHDLHLNKPVTHISQVLENNLPAVAGIKTKKRITYHDPCHLGRHVGEYDAPRKVIQKASGLTPVEMDRNRENATCCGNGAGLRTLFPNQAKLIGTSRIEDAKAIDAEILVTSCPFCTNMLKKQAASSLEVLDLPEFVIEMRKSRDMKDD
jgi:Fe-S oxidoreductase